MATNIDGSKSNVFLLGLIAAVAVGLIQYAPVVIDSVIYGKALIWEFASDDLSETGILRYVKDIFCLGFGVWWVVYCAGLKVEAEAKKIFNAYVSWVCIVGPLGFVGYMLFDTPMYYALAGVRWLLIFHCAAGFFFLSSGFTQYRYIGRLVFRWLVLFLLLDVAIACVQARNAFDLLSASIGASRSPGLLTNAGVAGSFLAAVSCFILLLKDISIAKRFLLFLLCLLGALLAGSRAGMICVFITLMCFVVQIKSSESLKNMSSIVNLLFYPLMVLVSINLFWLMLAIVDRGDLVSSQLSEGGRVVNFTKYFGEILSGDFLETLFGRGMGIGTNTAYTMALAKGIEPESIRFNYLVDNTFITLLFQYGFIGGGIFISGIAVFLLKWWRMVSRNESECAITVLAVLFVFLFTINVFEQYLFVMIFGATVGVFYWKAIRKIKT